MKKQRVLNKYLILCFVFFLVFLGFSMQCAFENEIEMCIIFAIFELLPIFVFITSPLYYVFSEERLVIVYNFGQREVIKWDEIRSITLRGSFLGIDGFPRYEIAYPKSRKGMFFVCGEVTKTSKTKRLLKYYYKRSIL